MHVGKEPHLCLYVYMFVCYELTSEELCELLLQFDSSVEGLPRLLLSETLVHLSGETDKGSNINVNSCFQGHE